MATSSRSMADRFGGISHADGGTFEVRYTGPFSLAASIRFLEGFTPTAYESSPPNHLDLAFCAGPLWHPVAVRVAERAGKVIGSFVGDVSPEAVAAARARWKTAREAGHTLAYWQQTESSWQKKG